MTTLEDKVKEVVTAYVADFRLFTALDVSNEVKETFPAARHREVRDIVRNLFTSDMVTSGYAKTPILVNLENGAQVEAILYHDLSDSWDLDNKYDTQKRNAVSKLPTTQFAVAPTVTPVVPAAPVVAASTVTTTPAPAKSVAKVLSSRELWEQLFKDKVSLFPNH